MDVVYTMPGQQHRMFINVIHACPNSCFFCVDFKGNEFYGFNLKNGRRPTAAEIVAAVESYPHRELVREVYYCGIGEPLLLYDTVIETVDIIRPLFKPQTSLCVNTSGTFYLYHRRVDLAAKFDLIQVSLNAESEEKYNLICRPKVKGAYQALMAFLRDLREYIDQKNLSCRVELSVVDPSDSELLPDQERGMLNIPRPNIDACQRIADGFGWPLKVKKLIGDCESVEWNQFAENIRTPVTMREKSPGCSHSDRVGFKYV